MISFTDTVIMTREVGLINFKAQMMKESFLDVFDARNINVISGIPDLRDYKELQGRKRRNKYLIS